MRTLIWQIDLIFYLKKLLGIKYRISLRINAEKYEIYKEAFLVAALPSPQIGDVINFVIAVNANVAPTIVAGTGGTLVSRNTSTTGNTRYLCIQLTSITTPAYTIY